jgi:hypothetical protein
VPDDDPFSLKVKMTRGTSAKDKDVFTANVAAPDIDTLKRRVEAIRDEMQDWADDFRVIQPDPDENRPHDDQQALDEVTEP